MKIEWEKINNDKIEIINGWLSCEDKHNLCMEEKSWMQTANDIEECINIMPNTEFKNIMGYVNGKPVAKLSDVEGKTMCKDEVYLKHLKESVNYRVKIEGK